MSTETSKEVSKKRWTRFLLLPALGAVATGAGCNGAGESEIPTRISEEGAFQATPFSNHFPVGVGSSGTSWRPPPTSKPMKIPPALSRHYSRKFSKDALIYDGYATAYGDVEAITSILDAHGKTYRTVSSDELDEMTPEELKDFGTIIWPGGYAGQMSASMRASTRQRIQDSVRKDGVGFVGFCAGAFIAVSPPAEAGEAGPSWGLAILPAETLPYYHLEDKGIENAMVSVSMKDGSQRDLVWWGGPTLPEVEGGVIGRYGDTKQPAIIQSWADHGMVVLAGPHPEAPEEWRINLGLQDSDGLDQDIAWRMMEAAMGGGVF